MLPEVIYFSSVSENTKRFVQKLQETSPDLTARRLPLRRTAPDVRAERPFVLVLPTYGGGAGESAVPKQVIRFLNDPHNRSLIRGVVSTGNTNFGAAFCIAGDIVSRKCSVPHLARVELFGTSEDVERVVVAIELIRE